MANSILPQQFPLKYEPGQSPVFSISSDEAEQMLLRPLPTADRHGKFSNNMPSSDPAEFLSYHNQCI